MNYVLVVLAVLAVASVLGWLLVRRSSGGGPGEPAKPHADIPPAAITAPPAGDDAGALEDIDDLEGPLEARPRRGGRLALLGDLAAGIAHEINNPVAIMVEEAGWIEDLLEEEEFRNSPNLEELRRALKQIKTQGARCKEVTQNLISFGQKASIKAEDVQLNDLIQDVVNSYDKRVRAGNIRIETELAALLPSCRLSPSQMQQVLLNLINNAIDALGEKGGRVLIRTALDGENIVIDVADTGPGIPPEMLDKIFDPFFTTKPVGRGAGLGLSICYGLVERMGGDITIESMVGEGAVFHVHIPIIGREAGARKAAGTGDGAPPAEETAAGAVAATPTVVLVVDDEVPFVEALGRRLARRNFEVHTAFSGDEALQILKRRREIDVVVLDVKMPGMDGIQALREIKASRPLTEVILLSAHTTVESAIEGIKLGAFDYLLKPCDMGQLVNQIERARRRKDRQEQRIMEARIKEITSRRI